MGTVTKVVIDTNIFISAFGWDGKPGTSPGTLFICRLTYQLPLLQPSTQNATHQHIAAPAALAIQYSFIHLRPSLNPPPTGRMKTGGIAALDHRLRAVNPPGSEVASRRDVSN